MFRSLGLFDAPCPDPACRRPTCFFVHGEPSNPKAKPTRPAPVKRSSDQSTPSAKVSPLKKRDVPLANSKRSVVTDTIGTRSDALKTPRVEERGKGMPASLLVSSRGVPSRAVPVSSALPAKSSPSAPASSSGGPSSAINTLKPPSIPNDIRRSPQPWTDRQKGLQTLFQQFTKLYSQILPFAPDLAHKSALVQEAEVSSSSTTVRAYKSAIHHAAVSISRRPVPDNTTHPSVGTVKESRAAHEKAEKAKASKPTKARIERYCLPIDDFVEWGYPDPRDSSLIQGGGEEPSAEGQERDCARCKVHFVVSSKDLADRFGECKFHHGRTLPERVEGKRKWIYTCCGKERGEAGCEEGVHVFTDGQDDQLLKARVGYRTVEQIVPKKDQAPRAWVDVVAMDCEMIYTTAGLSLARVTIVDEDGHILLDELVRQTVPVLDVNTRFSGVKEEELDKAAMDIEAVRAASCMFIGPNTIIVGHGLENDIRALRLMHDKVIDTAILFPHDKGRPYRRALRDIVKEKLGYFIQDRTSDLGHSSAEDAKATLECLKFKVREDGGE